MRREPDDHLICAVCRRACREPRRPSRRRRISRSQRWAAFGQVPIDRERTDIESNQNPRDDETGVAEDGDGRENIVKHGQQEAERVSLVLKESPSEVLRVLKELGCRPGGGELPGLVTCDEGELPERRASGHQRRGAWARLWSTPEARALVRTVAGDCGGQEAKLHRAWHPRTIRRRLPA